MTRDRVIVIGSGASGLTTSILLARIGHEVTLVECNPTPGGVMRSYSRRGVDLPMGIHSLGLLGEGELLNRLFHALGISELVPLIRIGEGGAIERLHTPQGRFDLPGGIDQFEEALTSAFPDDGPHIPWIAGALRGADGYLDCLVPGGRPKGDFRVLEHLGSMGDRARREGWSIGLQWVLSMANAWVGVPWDVCPEYLYATALSSYLVSAWQLEGGGAQLADAMATRLRDLGGEILVREAVEQIIVGDGAVRGVETVTGEHRAATVVSTIHPAATLALLAPDAVRPRYSARVLGLKDTPSCFGLHALVDSAHLPSQRRSHLVGEEPMGAMIRSFQSRPTNSTGRTLLTALEPVLADQWAEWADTRTGNRGLEYRAAKEAACEELLQRAARVFGPLGAPEVIDTFTPLSIRDWTGAPGGTIYGVSRETSQQLSAAGLRRPPVKGLVLAGQSLAAPGVLGAMMSACQAVGRITGSQEMERLFR